MNFKIYWAYLKIYLHNFIAMGLGNNAVQPLLIEIKVTTQIRYMNGLQRQQVLETTHVYEHALLWRSTLLGTGPDRISSVINWKVKIKSYLFNDVANTLYWSQFLTDHASAGNLYHWNMVYLKQTSTDGAVAKCQWTVGTGFASLVWFQPRVSF